MAEQSKVFNQALKKKGFFDFKDFYDFCFNWLTDERYVVEEEVYTEKLSGFGKEIIISWKAWKKVSDYFKNVIEMDWHILGMNDAEVEIDGKKTKTQKGNVKIKFKGILERDYEEKWEGKPFNKFLRGIYDKYIIRTTMEEYEDNVVEDATKLFGDCKAFLNLGGQ